MSSMHILRQPQIRRRSLSRSGRERDPVLHAIPERKNEGNDDNSTATGNTVELLSSERSISREKQKPFVGLIDRWEKKNNSRRKSDAGNTNVDANLIRGGSFDVGDSATSDVDSDATAVAALNENFNSNSNSNQPKNNRVGFTEDTKEPAPSSTNSSVDYDDTMSVMMEEYELEIQRLENLNATLTANVQALTAAALDDCKSEHKPTNGNSLKSSSKKQRHKISMEISPNNGDDNNNNNEFNNQTIYNEMSFTEEHYIHQISKLQKSTTKLTKKLDGKKKLIAQLSLSLKTAAEKITETSKEKEKYQLKYQLLNEKIQKDREKSQKEREEKPKHPQHAKFQRAESLEQIQQYQIQVLENECTSLLQLLSDKRLIHAADRKKLLNEYRDYDAAQSKLERPEETMERVMRKLRGGDVVADWHDQYVVGNGSDLHGTVHSTPGATSEGENDGKARGEVDTRSESGVNNGDGDGGASKGVNIWDSVTSLFGGPGSNGQQNRQQQQQYHRHQQEEDATAGSNYKSGNSIRQHVKPWHVVDSPIRSNSNRSSYQNSFRDSLQSSSHRSSYQNSFRDSAHSNSFHNSFQNSFHDSARSPSFRNSFHNSFHDSFHMDIGEHPFSKDIKTFDKNTLRKISSLVELSFQEGTMEGSSSSSSVAASSSSTSSEDNDSSCDSEEEESKEEDSSTKPENDTTSEKYPPAELPIVNGGGISAAIPREEKGAQKNKKVIAGPIIQDVDSNGWVESAVKKSAVEIPIAEEASNDKVDVRPAHSRDADEWVSFSSSDEEEDGVGEDAATREQQREGEHNVDTRGGVGKAGAEGARRGNDNDNNSTTSDRSSDSDSDDHNSTTSSSHSSDDDDESESSGDDETESVRSSNHESASSVRSSHVRSSNFEESTEDEVQDMSKVIRYSAYLPKWEDVCVAMNAKDERIPSDILFEGKAPDKIPSKIFFDENAPDKVSFLHTSSFLNSVPDEDGENGVKKAPPRDGEKEGAEEIINTLVPEVKDTVHGICSSKDQSKEEQRQISKTSRDLVNYGEGESFFVQSNNHDLVDDDDDEEGADLSKVRNLMLQYAAAEAVAPESIDGVGDEEEDDNDEDGSVGKSDHDAPPEQQASDHHVSTVLKDVNETPQAQDVHEAPAAAVAVTSKEEQDHVVDDADSVVDEAACENSVDNNDGGTVEVEVEASEDNEVLGHEVLNCASSVGSDVDEVDVACQENVRESSAIAVTQREEPVTFEVAESVEDVEATTAKDGDLSAQEETHKLEIDTINDDFIGPNEGASVSLGEYLEDEASNDGSPENIDDEEAALDELEHREETDDGGSCTSSNDEPVLKESMEPLSAMSVLKDDASGMAEELREEDGLDCAVNTARTVDCHNSIEEDSTLFHISALENVHNTQPIESDEDECDFEDDLASLLGSDEVALSSSQQNNTVEMRSVDPEQVVKAVPNEENAEVSSGQEGVARCRATEEGILCEIPEIDDSSDEEPMEPTYDYDTDEIDDDVAREARDEDTNPASSMYIIAADDSDDDDYNPKEYCQDDESHEGSVPNAVVVMKHADKMICGVCEGNDGDQAGAMEGETAELIHISAGGGDQIEDEKLDEDVDQNSTTSEQLSADADSEVLPDIGDIPLSIEIGPMSGSSTSSTMASSAATITDPSKVMEMEQRYISANITLADTLEMIKIQSKARLDGSEGGTSLSYYHNVLSQYTKPVGSTKRKKKDGILSHRLSRRELFQRQGSSSSDLRAEIADGVLSKPEDRQIMVTSQDIDKYMVPRYKPPVLPPQTNRGAAPFFKKGQKEDGYFLYKSSSGNEYAGHWKDGRRHGYGMARYRDGEVFNGEWKRGRRHGYGVLHLANTEVFDGNWFANKKHGIGVYYWQDGEVDVSWYQDDVRLESLRWTKDRRRSYRLDLSSSSKEQISLVRAADIVKGWERKADLDL